MSERPDHKFPPSMRDWFAGQALAGLLAYEGLWNDDDRLAKWCFEMADAMLAASREKEPSHE